MPLVVLPHSCDKTEAHVDGPEHVPMDVAGVYVGQDLSHARGVRPETKFQEIVASRKNKGKQLCREDELLSEISDANSDSLEHIEELLRAYDSCGACQDWRFVT